MHDHNDYFISLNMLFYIINITAEVEYEKKLPYLDILGRRTESNFEYSVYRKPTNKNALIYFFSLQYIKIK